MHEHLDGTREGLQKSLTDSANALHGRLDENRDNLNSTRDGFHASLTETRDSLHSSLSDTRSTVNGKLDEAREALHTALEETRDQVDATDRLEALAQRLEQVTSRLDTMTNRLDAVEDDFTARLEDDLDQIAAGNEERVAWLKRFYFGDGDPGRDPRVVRAADREDEVVGARAVGDVEPHPGEHLDVELGRHGDLGRGHAVGAGHGP